MQKRLCLILFFLYHFACAIAQEEKTYPFAHFIPENGLSTYNANSIVQDKDGFIWIGTINGLQRFDGHHFVTFRRIPGDNTSMTDNYIDHLFYDSKGNLWLVLGTGDIGIFDTRLFTFHKVRLKVKDERTLKLPRRLMEDSEGRLLYIIFGHEVTMYSTRFDEFSAAHSIVRLPNNWKVLSLAEDPSTKKYWMATDSGMCVFNTESRFLSYRGHNTERLPFIEKYGGTTTYQNLLIDSSSRFWYTSVAAGTQFPLMNCYNVSNNTLILDQQFLTSESKKLYDVKRIVSQANGKIWIGGLNIFMRFDEQQQKFVRAYGTNPGRDISFLELNTLFEDREQNIWISTNNNGVFIIKPAAPLFTSIEHFNRVANNTNEGVVTSMDYNNRNELLTAVWGDGLHRYKRDMKPFTEEQHTADEKKPFTVWSMCRLRNEKTFWMGLQEGILIYDVQSGNTQLVSSPLLRNRLVRTIAEDAAGNMWIGTPAAGVFKWLPSKGKANVNEGFIKIDHLPNSQIEKIRVDSKGFVWVCTLMNGVYKIDPANDNILEHISSAGPPGKRLNSDAVTDAFEYNDSTIIFPTGPLNFYNTRTRKITLVSSADGMPLDIVRSLEKDNKNYLWLAMFNGLTRMNVEKKTFTYYDRNDGMVNDNFLYSSSVHLPDGKIAFGTTTDFVIFDPNLLNAISRPPDVTITGFELMNRSLIIDSLERLPKVEVGPGQNFLTISYSGLSYYNKKYTYYYMLEGLDKDWNKTTEMNQVSYNYLPPGNYTFKVKTQNADGISSKTTELKIKVEPSLLRSWWFYSLIALFFALILFLIDRERMRRKVSMQRMRSDIADNLHVNVNTALNRINILSEMARLKSEKDPLKSTEYFEQIHDKSHEMIIAMDDMLWSIAPENDSMQRTIERIREYIDSLKSRYGANIDLLVDKKVESVSLNMKLRHDIFLMMKEGIRHVVLAGSKSSKIHIGLHRDGILYTLEIDNKDVNLQHLNNMLQQSDLERRLSSMNATLHSKMHRYTSIFELYVPVT